MREKWIFGRERRQKEDRKKRERRQKEERK